MNDRILFRARWWRGAWQYDKSRGNPSWSYLLMFTRPRYSCTHRTRLLGLPCLREPTYDRWCGLHNSMCSGHQHVANRCDGKLRDFDTARS